jgi:threonine synthase
LKGIWKYSHLLPQIAERYQVSLGEGNTPLIRSKRIGPILGLDNLYFKLEITNPSGSYKDRFAALAVADLLQHNATACFATSSGNTGSALAAYCASAGIRCYITIVDGAPSGKIMQMRVYGAETITVKDFGIDSQVTSEVMLGLRAIAEKFGSQVQISAFHYSPVGMAGVQTIAFEIAEELPNQRIQVFSPAGGGGLTLAVAKGFRLWADRYPNFGNARINCVQPEGNNTIAGSLRSGKSKSVAINKSTTTISGLQVPNIIDGDEVISICRKMNGNGYIVNDDLIYTCQADLANKEGIFCEPAGATALAGLLKGLSDGEINKNDHIVCLVTGHGFKDPVSEEKIAERSKNKYFDVVEESFRYIESEIKKIQK